MTTALEAVSEATLSRAGRRLSQTSWQKNIRLSVRFVCSSLVSEKQILLGSIHALVGFLWGTILRLLYCTFC